MRNSNSNKLQRGKIAKEAWRADGDDEKSFVCSFGGDPCLGWAWSERASLGTGGGFKNHEQPLSQPGPLAGFRRNLPLPPPKAWAGPESCG
ncbi:hypothetical protein VTJ04DRAFT_1201 [Mycothermus thermophilus]|uniref:uncharacterized protein n=1 Tax=Humicola insolens TaxID=85995 RepID=UPI003743F896